MLTIGIQCTTKYIEEFYVSGLLLGIYLVLRLVLSKKVNSSMKFLIPYNCEPIKVVVTFELWKLLQSYTFFIKKIHCVYSKFQALYLNMNSSVTIISTARRAEGFCAALVILRSMV